MSKLESIVIVNGALGSVATLSFSDPKQNRILSSTDSSPKSKNRLYFHIEDVVKNVTGL